MSYGPYADPARNANRSAADGDGPRATLRNRPYADASTEVDRRGVYYVDQQVPRLVEVRNVVGQRTRARDDADLAALVETTGESVLPMLPRLKMLCRKSWLI